MKNVIFSPAKSLDLESVGRLLSDCGLPHQDVDRHLSHFVTARQGDKLVGVVGLEPLGQIALVRSLAVTSLYRGQGLAKALWQRILAYAHAQGIKELFLLTLTTEGFFSKLGFRVIERNAVPEPIRNTQEFRSLCPKTALCMAKNIGCEAQYYPRGILSLQADVPGAKMWAVALEKAMLTYFEVEPQSRFEKHSHESEQITLVLSGALFFEIDDKIICVKQGEVIAIPSNKPHSAFTRDERVQAVDAWSPVMEKYQKPNQGIQWTPK